MKTAKLFFKNLAIVIGAVSVIMLNVYACVWTFMGPWWSYLAAAVIIIEIAAALTIINKKEHERATNNTTGPPTS